MRSASVERAGLGLLLVCLMWLPGAWAADAVGMSFSKLERCSDTAPSSSEGLTCWRAPAELGSGDLILAQGQIERQSSDLLAQFVGDLPRGTTVVFQSLGGDLMGGLRLGQHVFADQVGRR